MNYYDDNTFDYVGGNHWNAYGDYGKEYNNIYTESVANNKRQEEGVIKLKDLLLRHCKFLKEKEIFYYEVCDIKLKYFALCRNEATEERIREECLKNGEDYQRIRIERPGFVPLSLKVMHEGDHISFSFQNVDDRETLESWGDNKDILDGLYTEAKKIGRLNKTKEGFNLKLNVKDYFRYRESNVFFYINDESGKKIKELKELAVQNGFFESEIAYDINGYSNFMFIYNKILKEGDLLVIYDLSIIGTDFENVNNFFLKMIEKKVSFIVDNYFWDNDRYEQFTKEELIVEMLKFCEFYLKKVN